MPAMSVWNVARQIYRGSLDMSSPIMQFLGSATGYSQFRNTQASTAAQIDYNEYLKRGNERALADWQKNVGWQRNTSIKYPEFSYAGQIRGLGTASSRAMYDSNNAYSNFVGNLPYRGAGLYGIGGRIARWI